MNSNGSHWSVLLSWSKPSSSPSPRGRATVWGANWSAGMPLLPLSWMSFPSPGGESQSEGSSSSPSPGGEQLCGAPTGLRGCRSFPSPGGEQLCAAASSSGLRPSYPSPGGEGRVRGLPVPRASTARSSPSPCGRGSSSKATHDGMSGGRRRARIAGVAER